MVCNNKRLYTLTGLASASTWMIVKKKIFFARDEQFLWTVINFGVQMISPKNLRSKLPSKWFKERLKRTRLGLHLQDCQDEWFLLTVQPISPWPKFRGQQCQAYGLQESHVRFWFTTTAQLVNTVKHMVYNWGQKRPRLARPLQATSMTLKEIEIRLFRSSADQPIC